MKSKRTYLFFVSVVLSLALFTSCTGNSNDSSDESISITKIEKEIAEGGVLLDVRTTQEFNEGHIKGSINLSLQSIQSDEMPDIAKNKAIFVYCRSGNRSAQATTILKNDGYTNVTDLGGIEDVQAIGGILIK